MENVFLELFNMSITASWLVLAVILFRFVFKKVPKAFRVVMWGLVAFRLICPFSFESVLSIIPTTETLSPQLVHSNSSVQVSGSKILDYVGNNPVFYELGIKNGSVVFNEIGAPDCDFINPLLIITYIASIIWIVGMAIMLLYTAISYLRIVKKVREATPLENNIWICDNISTPFILGFVKPRIFIPSSMNDEDLKFVIAHEKAHIKRGDHLWKPLGFLLLTVYWFNPVLWVAYILFCRDIELACDEKVIKQMGVEIKKSYSEALINCSVSRKMVSACPLAFSETGVKGRIKSVLNYKKPAFWVIVVAVVSAIAITVCFMTNPEAKDNSVDLLPKEYTKNQYGIKNVTTGSEYEEVSIEPITISMVGDTRYINLLWENQTDRLAIFGEPSFIYRKDGNEWVEYKLPEGYGWNMLGYMLNPKDTTTHKYNYSFYEEFETGKYRFVTDFSFDENPQENYKVWIEFELVSINPDSDAYIPLDLVCDSGVFSLVQTADIAPTFYVTKDMELTTVYGNGLLFERGTLEKITLNVENWDSRFVSADWSEGYSCSQIRNNNKNAWQLKVDNGEDDISILFMLLEQNDGTYFMAQGMYNYNNINPANKDDSLIRWLYLVGKNATASEVGGANPYIEILEYSHQGSNDFAKISLNTTTKRFSFSYSLFSSYLPSGTYEEYDEYIVMKTDDGKNTYTFKKDDDKLIHDAFQSSPLPSYKYSTGGKEEPCLTDGAVFE